MVEPGLWLGVLATRHHAGGPFWCYHGGFLLRTELGVSGIATQRQILWTYAQPWSNLPNETPKDYFFAAKSLDRQFSKAESCQDSLFLGGVEGMPLASLELDSEGFHQTRVN